MTNHRQKLRLNDIDFQDRSVLVRVDFNVPIDDGVIIDVVVEAVDDVVDVFFKCSIAVHCSRKKPREDWL